MCNDGTDLGMIMLNCYKVLKTILNSKIPLPLNKPLAESHKLERIA